MYKDKWVAAGKQWPPPKSTAQEVAMEVESGEEAEEDEEANTSSGEDEESE